MQTDSCIILVMCARAHGWEQKMEKQLKFNEPWIAQRADPYICRHTDGMYYFTASVPAYDRIILRRADSLAGLADAEEITVWKKHESGIMSYHIWAPELHYLEGKWYLYFAAGEAENIWAIRPYVLECADADPITGTWKELGKCSARRRMNFLSGPFHWMPRYLNAKEAIIMSGRKKWAWAK